MRNVIIDFKRIFDTKLHRQFPHATPALFLSVQSALFPNGDDGVDVVELESIVIEKLYQQFADGHRVSLGKLAQILQTVRLVEVGVVDGALVVLNRNLGQSHAGIVGSAVPVRWKLLREMRNTAIPGEQAGSEARWRSGGSGLASECSRKN